MSDLTPETLADDFDPTKVSIMFGWLVYDVGEHTCGGYGPESSYAHEPGCGFEPMIPVSELPALLDAAAERDALLAERDALAAKVEDLECVLAGAGVCVECYANGWHKLDCSRRSTARALDGEARP